MQIIQNRRSFLTGLSAIGAAGLIRNDRALAASEPPPEVTTIRVAAIPAPCSAPFYLAEELLKEEGFTHIEYVPTPIVSVEMLANGDLDVSSESPADYLKTLDADKPIKVLAGIHTGCLELRANESIRSIGDLRGKRIGISAEGSSDHVLVSAMAAYVGLDPRRDIEWVTNSDVPQADLFVAGEVDAFIGAPPAPDQPCMSDAGHVVVNIATDKPWSQYFCCMAAFNANFMESNPIATKRALRAVLKAADIVHNEPERAAHRMADVGFSQSCARMHVGPHHVQFNHWRDYDPEDTVRFYALKLHEVGMIEKSPSEIISGFTDWRFLNEIKKELA